MHVFAHNAAGGPFKLNLVLEAMTDARLHWTVKHSLVAPLINGLFGEERTRTGFCRSSLD
jgi:hypothetical protein